MAQVIDYYTKKGAVNELHADRAADEVAAEIRTALKEGARS